MAVGPQEYPWFGVVNGDQIEQGDIFEDCPVFLPPDDINLTAEKPAAEFKWEDRDLIILSQSCDLVQGREKVDDVLLCAVWKRAELPTGHHLSSDAGMEDARKGRLPAYHLLAESNIDAFKRGVRVVDFRRVYSLPVAFVRKRASLTNRLRLMPPYREHLSQSFARFFMRVGLPVDIPPFGSPKGKK